MGLVIAVTVAFGAWIVLDAIGAKSFDALMLAILIMLVAGTAHVVAKQLPGNKKQD